MQPARARRLYESFVSPGVFTAIINDIEIKASDARTHNVDLLHVRAHRENFYVAQPSNKSGPYLNVRACAVD